MKRAEGWNSTYGLTLPHLFVCLQARAYYFVVISLVYQGVFCVEVIFVSLAIYQVRTGK